MRGIERTRLFRADTDRTDFLVRLAALAEQGALTVYAWALPNHAHRLVRTGTRPLPRSMRSLRTGSAGAVNRRQKRVGHLFQSRDTALVVAAAPSLRDRVRYLHLHPRRANGVPALRTLARCPWTGHSALGGTGPRAWRDTRTSLGQCGPRPRAADRGDARIRGRAAFAAQRQPAGASAAPVRRPALRGAPRTARGCR